MRRGRAVAETIHLLSLGLWFGALVMTGVTAAVIFPLMRELDPTLVSFESYAGSHADLLAGQVMARVFFVCDVIQLGAAVFATLTFTIVLVLYSRGPGKAFLGARLALLLVLLAVLGYYLFVLTPPMNQNLQQYWEAAQAGDLSAAAVEKAEFDAAHPLASNILKLITVVTLLTFVTGLWSVARSSNGEDAGRAEAPSPGIDRLEEPRLASQRH